MSPNRSAMAAARRVPSSLVAEVGQEGPSGVYWLQPSTSVRNSAPLQFALPATDHSGPARGRAPRPTIAFQVDRGAPAYGGEGSSVFRRRGRRAEVVDQGRRSGLRRRGVLRVPPMAPRVSCSRVARVDRLSSPGRPPRAPARASAVSATPCLRRACRPERRGRGGGNGKPVLDRPARKGRQRPRPECDRIELGTPSPTRFPGLLDPVRLKNRRAARALVSELAGETFTLAPVPHLPGRAAMPRAIGLRTVLIVGRSHQQMRDRPASCPKARRGLGVEILVVGQRASGGQRRVAVRRAYELWGTERRSKGAQVTSRREWGERSTWNGGALEPWRDRDRVRTCRRSAPVRKVPRGTQDAARPTGPVGRRAGPRSWS